MSTSRRSRARIAKAVHCNVPPQQVMSELDTELARLQADGVMRRSAPQVATTPGEPRDWQNPPGAPALRMADEKGRSMTQDYDQMLAAWRNGT